MYSAWDLELRHGFGTTGRKTNRLNCRWTRGMLMKGCLFLLIVTAACPRHKRGYKGNKNSLRQAPKDASTSAPDRS